MGILTQEMKDFVNKQRMGFVATVSPDNSPNLSPKGTTVVYDDEHLILVSLDNQGETPKIIDTIKKILQE